MATIGPNFRKLLADLPPDALPHLPGVQEGDGAAARALAQAVPYYRRAELAYALYLDSMPAAVLRPAVDEAWAANPRDLARICKTERRMMTLLSACDFPRIDLPPRIDIWRGTSGVAKADAELGFCWTLDREAAAWYALREAERWGTPLVLRRQIRPSAIVWARRTDGAVEIVPSRSDRAEPDGTEAEWRQWAEAFAARSR